MNVVKLVAVASSLFLSCAAPATRPAGVAVVELFTSQGCSSCPPAEAVLADESADAKRDGRAVFTLAFHVDYWDRGGWADPFSSAAYTQRQSGYSRSFHLDNVYTPQMVVNGRSEFVGSDRAAADKAIAAAVAAPPAVTLSVTVAKVGSGYAARYAGAVPAGSDVNVAVVERGLSTDVKGGENGGRRLDQPAVVRWFTTVHPIGDGGEVTIPALPAGVKADHATVVVYAQRPTDRAVLGAAAAAMP